MSKNGVKLISNITESSKLLRVLQIKQKGSFGNEAGWIFCEVRSIKRYRSN